MGNQERTYAEALKLLDSTQSNRTIVADISNSSRNMNEDAIPEMLEWTRKAGYTVSDLSMQGLRCVHVAGTKGKGSVSVMIENILLQYRGKDNDIGTSNRARSHIGKIGLYTSPHLITVRERMRIDGLPISEALFTRYFFELWDRLTVATANDEVISKPGYFRYLTLLALHSFIQEGVESAIIECGIGGEYDSTNILPSNAVTASAITKLGIDHIGMLGDTVEKIAWHKAGIMKHGVPAFTVEQRREAQAVLDVRARERGVDLQVVGRNALLASEQVKLGLEGDFQKDNASLAIAVAAAHLRSLGKLDETASLENTMPKEFVKGLKTVRWSGRCEVRKEGNIQWLIDGAHTIDSLKATGEWFLNRYSKALASTKPPTATMLIFNQQERDSEPLLRTLLESALNSKHNVFTSGAFCTNTPFKRDIPKDVNLKVQNKIANIYHAHNKASPSQCFTSVEEAVEYAREIAKVDDAKLIVLVTGSLHLVGGLLEVLNRDITAS